MKHSNPHFTEGEAGTQSIYSSSLLHPCLQRRAAPGRPWSRIHTPWGGAGPQWLYLEKSQSMASRNGKEATLIWDPFVPSHFRVVQPPLWDSLYQLSPKYLKVGPALLSRPLLSLFKCHQGLHNEVTFPWQQSCSSRSFTMTLPLFLQPSVAESWEAASFQPPNTTGSVSWMKTSDLGCDHLWLSSICLIDIHPSIHSSI